MSAILIWLKELFKTNNLIPILIITLFSEELMVKTLAKKVILIILSIQNGKRLKL